MSVNVEALLAVKAGILAAPGRLNMHDWCESTECGTTLCIAGWALHNAGYSDGEIRTLSDPENRAQRLLGLSESDVNLFYQDTWPDVVAQDEIFTSDVACKLIDLIIAGEAIDWVDRDMDDNMDDIEF